MNNQIHKYKFFFLNSEWELEEICDKQKCRDLKGVLERKLTRKEKMTRILTRGLIVSKSTRNQPCRFCLKKEAIVVIGKLILKFDIGIHYFKLEDWYVKLDCWVQCCQYLTFHAIILKETDSNAFDTDSIALFF